MKICTQINISITDTAHLSILEHSSTFQFDKLKMYMREEVKRKGNEIFLLKKKSIFLIFNLVSIYYT